ECFRTKARRPISMAHLDDASAVSPPESVATLGGEEKRIPESTEGSQQSVPHVPPLVAVAPNPADVITVLRTLPPHRGQRRRGRQPLHLFGLASCFDSPMQTSWSGCLLYPCRAWGLVRALAALLTSLTASAFLIPLADEQLEEVVVTLGLPAF